MKACSSVVIMKKLHHDNSPSQRDIETKTAQASIILQYYLISSKIAENQTAQGQDNEIIGEIKYLSCNRRLGK